MTCLKSHTTTVIIVLLLFDARGLRAAAHRHGRARAGPQARQGTSSLTAPKRFASTAFRHLPCWNPPACCRYTKLLNLWTSKHSA
ncbi:hypothetical protein MTO96_048324 [Rhipicephalus appendiculatus]